MTDSLGYRMKFGVVAPSTNTSVQPEFDDMRPVGVTNHFSRIVIPDDPVHSNEDFNELVMRIRGATMEAIDSVMTCSPQAVVMGMSAETFWDGKERADTLKAQVEERAGVPVTLGSDACQAALKCFGDVKRIAVITPYMPVGDDQVRKFFEDCGYEVATVKGLKCNSPMLIAHETPQALRDALIEVNDPSVEAIVQAGTNLAMAKVGAMAEFWLDKPVLAINTATYWHALRTNGIQDKVQGFGSLLSHY
ncbi:maleate cis-trans isomerase family protein [Celeribacter litoreus]|uniref:maleate cis-trans isomerase family protein n=1 Tax=Celeribacter litoreus TaxID=2876714 RepID=UPI001CCD7A0C|nr:arylmalonate decarboxylase [Celeribacter litoreus]MCA0042529.1 arylmalonate decarboxylase [Celeribacter litoreus]